MKNLLNHLTNWFKNDLYFNFHIWFYILYHICYIWLLFLNCLKICFAIYLVFLKRGWGRGGCYTDDVEVSQKPACIKYDACTSTGWCLETSRTAVHQWKQLLTHATTFWECQENTTCAFKFKDHPTGEIYQTQTDLHTCKKKLNWWYIHGDIIGPLFNFSFILVSLIVAVVWSALVLVFLFTVWPLKHDGPSPEFNL